MYEAILVQLMLNARDYCLNKAVVSGQDERQDYQEAALMLHKAAYKLVMGTARIDE